MNVTAITRVLAFPRTQTEHKRSLRFAIPSTQLSLEDNMPHSIDITALVQHLGQQQQERERQREQILLEQILEQMRNARIVNTGGSPGGTKLYHQTDAATANIILRTQHMKPGSGGLAGGGIYFATTPELTGHKAHRTGVILEVTVALGRIHTLDANGDPNMTLQKLKALGFDSVCIARPVSSGQEYVVYDPEQVLRIVEADQQGVASSRSPPPPPPPPPTVVHAAPVGRSGIPMRNVSRPTGAQKVAGIPMRNVDRM